MKYDTGRIYVGKELFYPSIAGKMKVKDTYKELKL